MDDCFCTERMFSFTMLFRKWTSRWNSFFTVFRTFLLLNRVNNLIHSFLNRDSSTWSEQPLPEERPPARGPDIQTPGSTFLDSSQTSVYMRGRASRMSRVSVRSVSKTMLWKEIRVSWLYRMNTDVPIWNICWFVV